MWSAAIFQSSERTLEIPYGRDGTNSRQQPLTLHTSCPIQFIAESDSRTHFNIFGEAMRTPTVTSPNPAASAQPGSNPATALQPKDYARRMETHYGNNMEALYTAVVNQEMTTPENRHNLAAILQHSKAFREHLGLRYERNPEQGGGFFRSTKSVVRMEGIPPRTFALAATLFDSETRVDRSLSRLEMSLETEGAPRYPADQVAFDQSFSEALLCLSRYLGGIPQKCQLRALDIVESYLPRIPRHEQQLVIEALLNVQRDHQFSQGVRFKADTVVNDATVALRPTPDNSRGRFLFQQPASASSNPTQAAATARQITQSGPSASLLHVPRTAMTDLVRRRWSMQQFEIYKIAIDDCLGRPDDFAFTKFNMNNAQYLGRMDQSNLPFFTELSAMIGSHIAEIAQFNESSQKLVASLERQYYWTTQQFEEYKNAIDRCLEALETHDDELIGTALAALDRNFAQYGAVDPYDPRQFQELAAVIGDYLARPVQELVASLERQAWTTQRLEEYKNAIDRCLGILRGSDGDLKEAALAEFNRGFAQYAGAMNPHDLHRFQELSAVIGNRIARVAQFDESMSPREVVTHFVNRGWSTRQFEEYKNAIDRCLEALRSYNNELIGTALAEFDSGFAQYAGAMDPYDPRRFQELSAVIGNHIARVA
jgi:uncharacterized protein YmfQ (DUF2313 family)